MDYKKAVEQIALQKAERERSAKIYWQELLQKDNRLYQMECKTKDLFLKSLADGKLTDKYNESKKEYDEYIKSLNLDKNLYFPAPICPECNDSGIVNGKPCRCAVKLALSQTKGADELPAVELESFDPSFFEGEQRKSAIKLLEFIKAFCQKFPETNKRTVIFTGGAGTGKTFAASAIAREVAKNGYSVCSLSAFSFVNRALKYHTDFTADKPQHLAPLLDSELLFVDDLGTESILKNVSLEYLYLVLNERINTGKHTIFTTNLNPDELLVRYGERIFSRLFHKTLSAVYALTGKDMRKM